MGTILLIVGWLACGVIAAGWAWADAKDWGLFWICLLFSPAGIIAMVIIRFIDQEAHGWAWPLDLTFQKFRNTGSRKMKGDSTNDDFSW